MHGVLHLDGKLAHTLPLLVFKPGQLTRRYIEGERARFVSPMAMFLFSVFAMFAVFQLLGISTPTSFEMENGIDAIEARLVDARAKTQAELADVNGQLADNNLAPSTRSDLARRKSELEADLMELEQVADLPFINASDASLEVNEDGETVVPIGNSGNAQMTFAETGVDLLDKGLAKKWRDNPGLMLYKLQANAYKFSWLLIPLSIPFVWLLFVWRRRFKAYDHAIFVTYSLGFMSLLFITLSLANAGGLSLGWIVAGFAALAPLHLYKHLRGAYGLSRFSTIWRFFALLIFIVIVLVLFLQALVLLGAF
ncbi:DUF3667 domain-containing protein [Erythrobacter sp.]|uniref:DUF3667 domain-containing protein n=1 Tax=Erythrobacter sp. TaxID=1042 RepID=UPI00341D2BEA